MVALPRSRFFSLVGTIGLLSQWTLHQKFRLDVPITKYLNSLIIFMGADNLPPATPLNYVP